MRSIARVLLSGLIGTVVCAVLSFLMFFMLTIFDNTKLGEAFGYSLLVGFLCAFIGVMIGLAIGIGDLGVIGGGIVGFLATLIVVAIYILFIGSPGNYGYFLSESRIVFIVLTLPTILTGIITALLKKLLYKLF